MPETRARLELALEAGNLGTWEWDLVEERLVWSETLLAIHGIEPGDFGGTFEDYERTIHPEDRARVMAALRDSVEAGVQRLEYRIVTSRGETRWLEVRGRVLSAPDGAPLKVVGVCGDVTDRKENELRLSRWRARREFIHQATLALTSSLDDEETLSTIAGLAVPRIADCCAVDLREEGSVRRVAVAHRDPEREDLVRQLHERFPPDPDAPPSTTAILGNGHSRLVASVTRDVLEAAARDEDHLALLERIDPSSYMVVPMRAGGELLGTIGFLGEGDRRFGPEDLRLAEQLAHVAGIAVANARSHRLLTEALESREELLAIVSHDLRNPLGTISLGAKVAVDALDTGKPQSARSSLERIQRASATMERLIRDLLNFAAIRAGTLRVDRAPCSVGELIGDAIETFHDRAETAGVSIVRDVNGANAVDCDRDRVLQALCNLIGNAIKFTSSGGCVTVSTAVTENDVVFSVSDTGEGISEEMMSSLFDPYRRGDRSSEGLGLGLYISRGIVEAHGGRLHVESRPGDGSTFSFTIPRTISEASRELDGA